MLQMKLKIILVLIMFIVIAFVFVKSTQNKIVPDATSSPLPANTTETACEKYIDSNNKSVQMFQGKPQPVNFSKYSEAKQYYTVITTTEEKGPNFAGHFSLARWGCGTDTTAFSIVDSKTGNIIAYQSCLGSTQLSYSGDPLNTRFLILNPVYAGNERKYYELVEKDGQEPSLDLVCTETSTKDLYGSPE